MIGWHTACICISNVCSCHMLPWRRRGCHLQWVDDPKRCSYPSHFWGRLFLDKPEMRWKLLNHNAMNKSLIDWTNHWLNKHPIRFRYALCYTFSNALQFQTETTILRRTDWYLCGWLFSLVEFNRFHEFITFVDSIFESQVHVTCTSQQVTDFNNISLKNLTTVFWCQLPTTSDLNETEYFETLKWSFFNRSWLGWIALITCLLFLCPCPCYGLCPCLGLCPCPCPYRPCCSWSGWHHTSGIQTRCQRREQSQQPGWPECV